MCFEEHGTQKTHSTPHLQVSRALVTLARPLLQLLKISNLESALKWLGIRCQAGRNGIALESIQNRQILALLWGFNVERSDQSDEGSV